MRGRFCRQSTSIADPDDGGLLGILQVFWADDLAIRRLQANNHLTNPGHPSKNRLSRNNHRQGLAGRSTV
jgi:hypothetical protein